MHDLRFPANFRMCCPTAGLVLLINSICLVSCASARGHGADSVAVKAAVGSLRNVEAKPLSPKEQADAAIRVDAAWKTLEKAGPNGRIALRTELEKVISEHTSDTFFRLNSSRLLWNMGGLDEAATIARAMTGTPLYPHYHYVFGTAFEAAKTQDPRALPILKAVLHDDQAVFLVEKHQLPLAWPENLRFIWGAFGSKGLSALRDVLANSHDAVELKSAAILVAQAQYLEALPELRNLAKSNQGEARNYAIEWLGEFGHPDDFEFLIKGLQTKEQELLESHIRALTMFEDLRAVSSLSPLLQSEQPSVRQLAIEALCCLATSQSVQALHEHAITTKSAAEKKTCEDFVDLVLDGSGTNWQAFSKLSPNEQAILIRKGDSREGRFQLQPANRRITRPELLAVLKNWKERYRITDKDVTAGPVLAVATVEDLPLLIDVRAAIYSRLSDECLAEVEWLNDIIRRLGRSRFRRNVGICEQVESAMNFASSAPAR